MMSDSISALLLEKSNGDVSASVRTLNEADLPGGNVLVDVAYSSLNYKDALAVTNRGKIVRGTYPFVPGIDLAGTVAESDSERYAPGDEVIVTGWGLGEKTWGGYAQRQRVQADWCVPLPEGLTLKAAMALGTAGFTAMLAVMALKEHDVTPERGEVVVTGASGGAGSLATALLSARGYAVVASTGSEDAHKYLGELGATRIVGRARFSEGPERPMASGQWAGAVDAVGGKTLATLISEMERHGSIAAFGNAGGHELRTTVFPFILRGINLLGVDSNTCPAARRRRAWERLARDLPSEQIERITSGTIPLEQLPAASERMLAGKGRGRLVVDVNA